MSIQDMRREFTHGGLCEADLHHDPIAQFDLWFTQARQTQDDPTFEPNAMTLATASRDGTPSARIVLLKGYDAEGFVFYTNYHSDKGIDLADNPHAALLFFWPHLDRQVRITGTAEKTSREQSESYFHSRPRGSQIGAFASDQSRVLANREELEQKVAQLETTYADKTIPLPEHWGGYCLKPASLEFWQGRPSRLHDRLRYKRQGPTSWRLQRLAP